MGALTPLYWPLALLALALACLWGVTLRACWQHIYTQSLDPEAPPPWGWIISSALVLSLALWTVMVMLAGALDLSVPLVVQPSALVRSLLGVMALHLVVFALAPHLPRDTQRRQRVAMFMALSFSGCTVLSMLYLVTRLNVAPMGAVPLSMKLGMASLMVAATALSYRQIKNRWRGGLLNGLFCWLMTLLGTQALDWPPQVYYIGAKGATTLTWLSLPLALSALFSLSSMLTVAWLRRHRHRLASATLPDLAPPTGDVEALAEARAREIVEDRKRKDVLYDKVLRHSCVRFWELDIHTGQFLFRGDLSSDEALRGADVIVQADDWFRAHLHPEEVVALQQVFLSQVESKGSFDVIHRLRQETGKEDWRWVIDRGTVVRRNATGQPTYMVGTHIDITEHRELQTAIDRDSRLFSEGPLVMIRWQFDANTGDIHELDFISPNIEKLWGYGLEELSAPQSWRGLIEAQDLEGIGLKMRNAVAAGHSEMTYELRIRLKDGRELWHSLFARLETHEHDGYVNGFIVDIDAFKRVEQRTREQARQLEELIAELQRAKEETVILRESSEFLNSAETLDEAFDIISRAAYAIFPGWSGALASAHEHDRLRLAGRWGNAEAFNTEFSAGDCWSLRRGRAHHFVDERASLRCRHVHTPLGEQPRSYLCIPMSANGETVGSLHLMAPKPLNKEQMVPLAQRAHRLGETLKLALSNLRLRAGLREQATHDGLTGLYNRRFMDDRLPVEIARCAREGQHLALAMIDVDHFKRFNDQYGHDAGDTVLRALGELLRQRVRVYDLACRYGGEELSLIMPGCTLEDAVDKLELIRAEVAGLSLMFNGTALPRVTISVGLADTLGGDAMALVKQADERLYHAKHSGRNRLVSAMDTQAPTSPALPAPAGMGGGGDTNLSA